MEYVGRNVHLVRSSDALITVGGRMGSLHEFVTAVEAKKVIGVLLGSGGLADFLPTIIDNLEGFENHDIIYDNDPVRLVSRIVKKLDSMYADFQHDGTDSNVKSLNKKG